MASVSPECWFTVPQDEHVRIIRGPPGDPSPNPVQPKVLTAEPSLTLTILDISIGVNEGFFRRMDIDTHNPTAMCLFILSMSFGLGRNLAIFFVKILRLKN